jgi:plastocyanin
MDRTHLITSIGFAAVFALAVAACGGGSSPSGPSPAPGGGGGGGTPIETNTITIGASGADPRAITIGVGSRVTFVNNDTRSHDMNSGPHPEHTQCPELNVGPVPAGQSRESRPFTAAKTCSFHDHELPTSTSLQGTVTAR